MDALGQFVDLFLHLDHHLAEMAATMGPTLYLVLFAVVFAETGLVVTPFLPGDSLLFATGALAALPNTPLNVHLTVLMLWFAAVLGDATNYAVGRTLGPAVFSREDSWWLRREHLNRTRKFYEKHGGKTIILARFVPIVRTFAPFVAGVGQMSYPRFASFNLIGAAAWVVPFVYAGFFFGNLPSVKSNFHVVILAIIVLSVLPAVYEAWKARNEPAEG
jgi:membrane-associated protein